MPETALHLQLKRAACKWLWQLGYAAIAEEVHVPAVGIIDVAGAGRWRRYNPRSVQFGAEPVVDRKHVVFVECKAFRGDFLQDQGRQKQFEFELAERAQRLSRKRRTKPRHAHAGLGKFDRCLLRPHANQHYIMTPPKLLKADEVPRRWGWLVYDWGVVRVVRKPTWVEVAEVSAMEGAIARSLTARRMALWNAQVPPAQPAEVMAIPAVGAP